MDGKQRTVTWADVAVAAEDVACRQRTLNTPTGVWGVPRGGSVPAVLVANLLGVPILDHPQPGCLIVDDLVDSGRTAALVTDTGYRFDALFRKPHSPVAFAAAAKTYDEWLVFPWEAGEHPAEDAVVRLLEAIGEDPTREGLLDTPKRVVKAMREMTEGSERDAAEVLGTTFDVGNVDELILVSGVEFSSMCEHHLLPFVGTATVGYLPAEQGRVVGLSKLARLVDLFAHRLQVQERMTSQIAEAIMEHLGAQAAGVIVAAHHSCMGCRGVRKNAVMVTSSMLGRLRTDPTMRAEFTALAG